MWMGLEPGSRELLLQHNWNPCSFPIYLLREREREDVGLKMPTCKGVKFSAHQVRRAHVARWALWRWCTEKAHMIGLIKVQPHQICRAHWKQPLKKKKEQWLKNQGCFIGPTKWVRVKTLNQPLSTWAPFNPPSFLWFTVQSGSHTPNHLSALRSLPDTGIYISVGQKKKKKEKTAWPYKDKGCNGSTLYEGRSIS